MKLIFLLGLVYADEEENESGSGQILADFEGKSIKSTSKLLSWIETQNPRKEAKNFRKALNNYGCHCFVGNSQYVGGSGPPVDEIDMACRDLYLAHQCLSWDSENADFARPCDGEDNFAWYGVGNEIKCGMKDNKKWAIHDKNQCKMALCRTEKRFAERISDIIDTLDVDNYDAKAKGKCEIQAGSTSGAGSSGAMQCCGEYPTRKPAPAGVDVMCCGSKGKTYTKVTHECCNGEPKAFGGC